MSPMKKLSILLIGLIILTTISAFSDEKMAAQDNTLVSAITKMLTERTNGNNGDYNKVLAPAMSLNLDQNKSSRVEAINSKITSEINVITVAFAQGGEENKISFVKEAAKGIEPELIKNNGAFITFIDQNPSAAFSRVVAMIPKTNAVNGEAVFRVVSSYKHSAKPSDFVYEYENPLDLTMGNVKSFEGSDTSWKGNEAAAGFTFQKNYTLKKCRQLLGWRCVTSLYRADQFKTNFGLSHLLFVATYDLTNNPDHSDFAKDKRSKNQISGSTATYVVIESAKWILLYGIDAQWNDDKLSFKGAIQTEFQKDFGRLKERLTEDLKVQVTPLN